MQMKALIFTRWDTHEQNHTGLYSYPYSSGGFLESKTMGTCMSKICQCHFCRCCECGPSCHCCRCCKKYFGDWWMCCDCCESDEEDEMYLTAEKAQNVQKPPDEGEGMYKYPNGDFYVGEWRRGKRHGYGEFITKDGSRYVGFFYDDEYVGDQPDERLRRSPVTSRPFSKSFKKDEENANVRKQDTDEIQKTRAEEKELLREKNGPSYSTVDNGN